MTILILSIIILILLIWLIVMIVEFNELKDTYRILSSLTRDIDDKVELIAEKLNMDLESDEE